ncbi:MAG: 2-dehydropantoate 2-reductase [Planctomycetota bacterium]|nr:2-dehydropantoate 2-reductase [Planctomycetota bacterium]
MMQESPPEPNRPSCDVAIVGAGALGRWLAARIVSGQSSSAGDVVLVTRPGTTSGVTTCCVRDNNLLDDESATTSGSVPPARTVAVPSAPAASMRDRVFPLVLLCTKATDLADAMSEVAPLVEDGGTVAVLSNGLGHEQALGDLGVKKCVAATVTYGLLPEPDGTVQLRGDGGEIAIGPLDTSNGEPAAVEDATQVALRLASGGLRTRVVDDGRPLVWKKAMLNAGLNPVAALLGCKNGELPEHPAFALSVEAAREGCQAASVQGVALSGVDPEQLLRELCRDTAPNRCSTLQDLSAGRRTEIDWICGAIERALGSAGLDSPANTLLSALVRRAEVAYETC